MATQTRQFFADSNGSTASLIYDDVALTASGVLVHVPADATTVTVNAMVGGNPINLTYEPGTDTTFTLPEPMPISFITTKSGGQGIVMSWLESVAISIAG